MAGGGDYFLNGIDQEHEILAESEIFFRGWHLRNAGADFPTEERLYHMKTGKKTHVFSLGIVLVQLAMSAAAEKRSALVMANEGYLHCRPLGNPANDGRGVAAKLRTAGFAVTVIENGDREGMRGGLEKFAATLDSETTALVFYAGHGVQVGGRNFLLPVDAKPDDESKLESGSVALDWMLDRLNNGGKGSARLKIVILDCCRDDPFGLNRGGSRSLTQKAGLAAPDRTSKGTILCFSTDPGSVAADGEGENSPYTAALLEHFFTPRLGVLEALSRVGASVQRATNERQNPWRTTDYNGSFVVMTDEPAGEVTAGGVIRTMLADEAGVGELPEGWVGDTVMGRRDDEGVPLLKSGGNSPAELRARLGLGRTDAFVEIAVICQEALNGFGGHLGSIGISLQGGSGEDERVAIQASGGRNTVSEGTSWVLSANGVAPVTVGLTPSGLTWIRLERKKNQLRVFVNGADGNPLVAPFPIDLPLEDLVCRLPSQNVGVAVVRSGSLAKSAFPPTAAMISRRKGSRLDAGKTLGKLSDIDRNAWYAPASLGEHFRLVVRLARNSRENRWYGGQMGPRQRFTLSLIGREGGMSLPIGAGCQVNNFQAIWGSAFSEHGDSLHLDKQFERAVWTLERHGSVYSSAVNDGQPLMFRNAAAVGFEGLRLDIHGWVWEIESVEVIPLRSDG